MVSAQRKLCYRKPNRRVFCCLRGLRLGLAYAGAWSAFMFGLGYSKEKSRAAAERYLQQNKLQNAIAEYEKILQVEPRDFVILNQVGDIYARLGQNDKAIERFRAVGEAYAADGLNLKSIAMYKKITKLDPNALPSMEKLAELYRKQGLVSDARGVLLQAADAYGRRGQNKETLRLLKQLVLFDPENVLVITRTADLMTQNGQLIEAREMLSQTASTLIVRHSLEAARKILERLLVLDKNNLRAHELQAQVVFELGDAAKAAELYEAIPDLDSRADGLRNLFASYLTLGKLDEACPVARKLVTVHQDVDGIAQLAARFYAENRTAEALELYNEFCAGLIVHDREGVVAHLHGILARVRTNPEALQTLYNLFRLCGEDSMIAEILELTAHACVQANQFERARDAYKELIEREPENASHIQAYRQICAHIDPNSPAPPIPTKREEPAQTFEDFRASNEPDLPKQSYPPEIADRIAAALSEADLCDSYASKSRGIAALEAALQSAPGDLQVNRLLAQLYTFEGKTTQAARCYNTMQRVLDNLGLTEAASFYANLAGPESGSEQTTTWETNDSEFTREFDLAAGQEEVGSNAEEIDLSGEWESVWPAEPAAPPAAPVQPPPVAAVPAPVAIPAAHANPVPAPQPDPVAELLDEARFCLAQQIWDQAETAISRLASVAPQHPELPALFSELRRGRPAAAPDPVSAPAPNPAHAPAAYNPAPEPSYEPVEVIEVFDSAPASSAAHAHPPKPTPADITSLAAELDAEVGDLFAEPSRVVAPPPAVSALPTAIVPPVASVPIPPPPAVPHSAAQTPAFPEFAPHAVVSPVTASPLPAPSAFEDFELPPPVETLELPPLDLEVPQTGLRDHDSPVAEAAASQSFEFSTSVPHPAPAANPLDFDIPEAAPEPLAFRAAEAAPQPFNFQASEQPAPEPFALQVPEVAPEPLAPLAPPATHRALPIEPQLSPVEANIAEDSAPRLAETEAPSVFGELIEAFEQDLAVPQQDEEDPETHFNLGIAFREMGLLDEAIGELQKVCRFADRGLTPARAREAYIWLATCFVEKSVPEASFSWYLKALQSASDEEQRTALNYELASAYEAAGRKREALEHFMQVYGSNIDYRDVAERIRELRAAV